MFPRVSKKTSIELLIKRGFDNKTADLLADQTGGNLPRLHLVPNEDPFTHVKLQALIVKSQIEACMKESDIKLEIKSAVQNALKTKCCDTFQFCLLTWNVLNFNAMDLTLDFESSISEFALTI